MDSPVMRIAKSTRQLQDGILVAGVTVIGVAFIQSIVIVLSWIL